MLEKLVERAKVRFTKFEEGVFRAAFGRVAEGDHEKAWDVLDSWYKPRAMPTLATILNTLRDHGIAVAETGRSDAPEWEMKCVNCNPPTRFPMSRRSCPVCGSADRSHQVCVRAGAPQRRPPGDQPRFPYSETP